MARFKRLSTDEWSYLPGRWALFLIFFLRVASVGPLAHEKKAPTPLKSVCLPSLLD